jgi:hypothetical protein
MKYGISVLGVIPLRKEPSHRSEQVSQLLFGETYEVIGSQESWLQVKCNYDGYEGWIEQNQHRLIGDKEFNALTDCQKGVALELLSNASSNAYSIPIPAGSTLPYFDGMNFKAGKEKFIYNGQAIMPDVVNSNILERIAFRYLNTPYLWGGRSPLGIDCSGFTQVVFKFCGLALKRDAYQQAEHGTTLNFVEESQIGDLAFFANSENKITHVGMIIKDQRIIHASGRVRVDKLDHFGIYNSDLKKYSHQLKLIKRLF